MKDNEYESYANEFLWLCHWFYLYYVLDLSLCMSNRFLFVWIKEKKKEDGISLLKANNEFTYSSILFLTLTQNGW